MGEPYSLLHIELSTVKNSDVIMVLEQGRIIERGSHEKLLKKNESIINYIPELLNWNNLFKIIPYKTKNCTNHKIKNIH